MNAVESFIKEAIYEVALQAVAKRLLAALPFLAWGPLNIIFMWFLEKIFDVIYEELSMLAKFEIIAFQNEADRRRYEEAVKKVREDFNGTTKQEFRDSLRNVVTFRVRAG
jgi:hypothetical protein